MFEAVESLVTEHQELEKRLAEPGIHADQGLAKKLNQRYAELSAILRAYADWQHLVEDIEAARELAAEDPSFAEEAEALADKRAAAEERLRHLLVPREATDSKDALLEIKSGEGGEESALFAGDLLRMYTRYAEQRGWKTEILDATESDLGGYKSVTVAVKAKGTSEPGEAPYALLKFEGGVHRVQRVPVTESQGRVHTSAAGVLVTPEAEQVDVSIEEKDLRIDVYRSSGPGGQSVNTTDSAVRITHVPTGIVASCQNEKSQLQNREQAMRILRSRLLQAAQDAADAEASDARRSQVRTVDRSERIRTYNFPENRISDHRTGYKSYNLDQVLNGELEPVIASCVDADLTPGSTRSSPRSRHDHRRFETPRGSAPRPRRAPHRHRDPGRRGRAEPRLRRRRAARPRAGHHADAAGARRASCRPSAARSTTTSSPGGPAASRCSTSPGRPRSATSSSPWGPGSSPRAPRPSCSPAGAWTGRARCWPPAGRRWWWTCAPARAPSRSPSRRRSRRRRCTPSS